MKLHGRVFARIMRLTVLLSVLILAGFFAFNSCSTAKKRNAGWEKASEILSKINPPMFPDTTFVITNFGAVGDGNVDCSEAIKQAIESCSQAGGGRVYVPEGTFLTGPIHLKSNVNLHLEDGAVLLFSTDISKYLPVVFTRFEGVECLNYSPFIYAFEQENIAITGKGLLDGQASNTAWWNWTGSDQFGWQEGMPSHRPDIDALNQMAENGVPVSERIFGEGHYLRPNFIQPYRCKNILISGITLKRSPMWEIHPVLCENVTIQNVVVMSHGPNNDGCNPESSKNVLIKNCFFDTGDDCIAIKSGRNADGRRVNEATENVIIQSCTMRDGHGGVVIGSEMSGSVKNVYAENCTMDSPNLDRALRIKTNSQRGGEVENIFMRHITVGAVSDAIIRVNFNYGEGDAGQFTPKVSNIFISNMTSNKSQYALRLEGYDRSPISNIFLDNCNFSGVRDSNLLMHVDNLQMDNVYINGVVQR